MRSVRVELECWVRTFRVVVAEYVRTNLLCAYNQNMSGQIYRNVATKASATASAPLSGDVSVLAILAGRLAAPVDALTRARAATHVLDWLGSAALGYRQPGAVGFATLAVASSVGTCRTIGGDRADWWHALQINAALGNMMEMDDLHRSSILHPGPVIVPAAIAVAEKVGATGAQLLDAIVRGYEATIRIGRALGTSHYKYFHNTSTCGAFGAAVAAASLLKLSPEQTVWALANAGSRSGGLWQMRHEACETKSLHNAMAAQSGVQCALLAAQGVRGPSTLLEGPQGMFAAMTDGANARAVVDDLDARWQIHDVSFKPWPACRHAHPAIDAAMAIAAQCIEAKPRCDVGSIASIKVATYRSAIDFCNKPDPITEAEAKFSLQHCVAVALLRGMAGGKPMLADFVPGSLHREDIAALRKRVRVVEDRAMSAQFPRHYGAAVSVTFSLGNTVSHQQADAWGDPELPLSIEALNTKFVELLCAADVDTVTAGELVTATFALPSAASVSNWSALWPSLAQSGSR